LTFQNVQAEKIKLIEKHLMIVQLNWKMLELGLLYLSCITWIRILLH